jgi:demethylmenaquinone methyltransferase / 2-methoxy-6-polyprenyl-1,4-benzoquinol methylase
MQPSEKQEKVQRVFARIARRYDLMNSLMTFGMHRRWRRQTLRAAGMQAGAVALDIGCGSGDYIELLLQAGASHVIGVDFTKKMLDLAAKRFDKEISEGRVVLVQADAARMSLVQDGSVDIVTAGFALRNFANLPKALAEAYRVLKPGGKLVSLDLGKPFPLAIGWAARIYLDWVVPSIAAVVSGTQTEYRWLSDSLEQFPERGELVKILLAAGFASVRVIPYGMGVLASHIAQKAS